MLFQNKNSDAVVIIECYQNQIIRLCGMFNVYICNLLEETI